MRRVLILGGTKWLGRRIAGLLLAAGDEVTCLARGRSSGVPDGARLVAADRSTSGAYDQLDGEWDEVVELAYAPRVVGSALEALAGHAAHWTLVSTVSVYANNDRPGEDEAGELVEPVDLEEYPQAKVAAERASSAMLGGERLLIVRPGLIAGPGDPSDRFGYWPMRLHRGGDVLTPTSAGRDVQVIDVDDLAAFIEAAGRRATTGVVNAVGDSVPFADFLRITGGVTRFRGRLVEAGDDWLTGHDVHHWMGERSLPLWLPASEIGFARRSNAAYLAVGGRVRPILETIERVLEDEIRLGVERPRRSGISPEEEYELLRELG